MKNWVVFGLSNGLHYAEEISKMAKIQLGQMQISRFADGEILIKSKETVRNCDCLLIQSTSSPVNDNLMELLIGIDALKRASAHSITVIIPYFGYSRQDRKAKGREPISCKLVAGFLEKAGATKVILMDIHSEQTQGFFDIPVDTLRATTILLNKYLENTKNNDFTIVAPDYGAVKKARDISEHINVPLAIIDKRRPKPNVVEVSNVLGDVENQNCVLIDDMIDTGGTILSSASILKDKKAKSVSVLATHGVFSNNAIEKFINAIESGIITDLYITDTIIENLNISHPKIHIISLSTFFAEIITAQMHSKSVSKIYDKYWDMVLKRCPQTSNQK